MNAFWILADIAFIFIFVSLLECKKYKGSTSSRHSHEPGEHLGLHFLLHVHHEGGELYHLLLLYNVACVVVGDGGEDGQAGVWLVRHILVHGFQTIQTTGVVWTGGWLGVDGGVGHGLKHSTY